MDIDRLHYSFVNADLLGARRLIASTAPVVSDYSAPTHVEITVDVSKTDGAHGDARLLAVLTDRARPWDFGEVVFAQSGRMFAVDADELILFLRAESHHLPVGLLG
jgi:hypothetical protein